MRKSKELAYNWKVQMLFLRIKNHFGSINQRTDLTEADKKRLKEFYLENLIAPKAREILKTHFSEEFNTGQRTAATKSKPAS